LSAPVLPPQSRLTLPGAARTVTAPRSGLGEALRASREALGDVERQLELLLGALRSPGGVPDGGAPDRLRTATSRAGHAIDQLAQV
jgi:hypothetical protein